MTARKGGDQGLRRVIPWSRQSAECCHCVMASPRHLPAKGRRVRRADETIRQAIEAMLRVAGELGLTPSDRPRSYRAPGDVSVTPVTESRGRTSHHGRGADPVVIRSLLQPTGSNVARPPRACRSSSGTSRRTVDSSPCLPCGGGPRDLGVSTKTSPRMVAPAAVPARVCACRVPERSAASHDWQPGIGVNRRRSRAVGGHQRLHRAV